MERTETNRDRVRRLLLQKLGFRRPKGVSETEERIELDRICDDLAYLSDEGLRRVEAVMRTKGEGSRKDFWPRLASFRAYAEIAEPRPIAEIPALRRWFGSVEGPRALEAGTVVETLEFFQKFKRPPVYPADRKAVADRARDNQRRVTIFEERRAANLANDPVEAQFFEAYARRLAAVTAMIEEVRSEADGLGAGAQ